MRAALFLFSAAVTMFAQTGGTISGTVTDPDGTPVPNAALQASHLETGQIYKTTSSAKGHYALSPLPAGNYEITIPPIGFSFARLEKKDVMVQASRTVHVDLRLAWGGNLGTPGDDPLTFNRSKPAPLGKPVPHTANGKPDLSGVWYAHKDTPETPTLLPWAEEITKKRAANGAADQPSNYCLPGDPLLTLPLFYRIVQTPQMIVMLWEGQPPGVRQVFLDQPDHSKAWGPTWLGHSIARWDQDTLVVDTAVFNDRSWLGIYPHTEKLHVTERWRRTELARLEKQSTVEDPETFTKPWSTRAAWDLDLNEEIHEYICNENDTDIPHLTGRK